MEHNFHGHRQHNKEKVNNVKMDHYQKTSLSDTALPTEVEFTNISLDVDTSKRKKVPRRIIHCSDGILEEYSTDEEDTPPPPPPVDLKTLTWGPWMWHYMATAAYKTYSAADSCGEKLSWFFGITSPKYQSAIDEFYRLKAEEEREEEEEKRFRERNAGLASVKVTEKGQTGDKGHGDQVLEKF